MTYQDTLKHIDGALDGADYDWAVSDDAMRWSPDRIPEPPIERLHDTFDADDPQSTINNELLCGLRQAEDNRVLNGTGIPTERIWTDATHSSLPLSALFLSANRDLRRPQ